MGGRAFLAPAAAAMLVLLQPGFPAAAPTPPPKTITNTASLGFGRFVPNGGGTVKVDVNGLRTRSGGVVLLSSSANAAQYAISAHGNDNRIYILTLPANGSVALRAGAHAMPVDHFVSSAPAGGLLPTTSQSVSVGATLQVAPSQSPGNYSGSFQVTLEYQ